MEHGSGTQLLDFEVMAQILLWIRRMISNIHMMNNTHHVVFWSTTHPLLGETPPSEDVLSSISVSGVQMFSITVRSHKF